MFCKDFNPNCVCEYAFLVGLRTKQDGNVILYEGEQQVIDLLNKFFLDLI